MFCGLVFGSLSDDVPPIEEYLGEEVASRIKRVLHKPVVVTGRFTQMLPNNWKLYFENVKDTYHASLLHTFFTTFRINRLSQRGGMVVSPDGGSHASFSFIDKQSKENDYAAMGIRSDNEDFALKDPSLLDNADEFGDGCHMQILTVYPNMVLQQIQNALAIRQVLPKGQTQTALNWTTIGFADDTPEMKTRRLRQNNLAGPAGYVSMEDGAVGGFVQRGVAAAGGERAVLEMGGSGTASEGTRATEASVRGFWKSIAGIWESRWLGRDHARAHPGAAGRLYPLHRQQRAGGMAGFLPRPVPLHRHDGGEPQERLRVRHHLRRHQGHADRPHRRAPPGQCLREAELPPHPRPAEHPQQRRRRGRERDAVPGGAHHARRPERHFRDRASISTPIAPRATI